MKTVFKYFLYVVYCLVVALLFLYIRFPADAAKKYIAAHMQANYPDLRISMERVKPAFPIGLSIQSGFVHFKDDAVIDVDEFKILIRPWNLIRPNMTYHFSADTNGGMVKGTIKVAKQSAMDPIQLDAGLFNIQLKDVPFLKALSDEKLSGICDGKVRYSRNKNSPGTAVAELKISDFNVTPVTNVSSLNNIQFKQISANFDYKARQIIIKNCTLNGSQLDGRFSGALTLKQPMEGSLIDLTGTIVPHHQFLATLNKDASIDLFSRKRSGESSFPFMLKGRLDSPEFSLN